MQWIFMASLLFGSLLPPISDMNGWQKYAKYAISDTIFVQNTMNLFYVLKSELFCSAGPLRCTGGSMRHWAGSYSRLPRTPPHQTRAWALCKLVSTFFDRIKKSTKPIRIMEVITMRQSFRNFFFEGEVRRFSHLLWSKKEPSIIYFSRRKVHFNVVDFFSFLFLFFYF